MKEIKILISDELYDQLHDEYLPLLQEAWDLVDSDLFTPDWHALQKINKKREKYMLKVGDKVINQILGVIDK